MHFILGVLNLLDFVFFAKVRDIFRSAEQLSGPGNPFVILSYLK